MSAKAQFRLASIALIAFVGISFAALPAAALHWSGSAAFGPTSAYQGATTTFTFRLNNQASGTLDIAWVWVHFCWEASNVGYYFKPNDGSTLPVSGGGSRDFTGDVPVSQTTLGNCAVGIQANGRAGGDLYFGTASYAGSITVLQVPPLQVSIAANPNNGQAPLAVSFSSTVTGGLGPYTYAWTFGDGGTSSVANPAYSYQTSGTYTVTLVVTDSMSNQKSATATVTVTTPGFGSGVVSGLGIFVWIVVAIVLIAAVIGVVMMFRRRRHAPPPPMPPSP